MKKTLVSLTVALTLVLGQPAFAAPAVSVKTASPATVKTGLSKKQRTVLIVTLSLLGVAAVGTGIFVATSPDAQKTIKGWFSSSKPNKTGKAGSTPAGSTPAGSTPAGSTPAGSTPAGSTPAGSTPAGSTPAGSTQQAPSQPGTTQSAGLTREQKIEAVSKLLTINIASGVKEGNKDKRKETLTAETAKVAKLSDDQLTSLLTSIESQIKAGKLIQKPEERVKGALATSPKQSQHTRKLAIELVSQAQQLKAQQPTGPATVQQKQPTGPATVQQKQQAAPATAQQVGQKQQIPPAPAPVQ